MTGIDAAVRLLTKQPHAVPRRTCCSNSARDITRAILDETGQQVERLRRQMRLLPFAKQSSCARNRARIDRTGTYARSMLGSEPRDEEVDVGRRVCANHARNSDVRIAAL